MKGAQQMKIVMLCQCHSCTHRSASITTLYW